MLPFKLEHICHMNQVCYIYYQHIICGGILFLISFPMRIFRDRYHCLLDMLSTHARLLFQRSLFVIYLHISILRVASISAPMAFCLRWVDIMKTPFTINLLLRWYPKLLIFFFLWDQNIMDKDREVDYVNPMYET